MAGQLLTKVVDLIDPSTNSSDEDLIRQIMWPIDVQRILSIPISQYHNMICQILLLGAIRKMVCSWSGLPTLGSGNIGMEIN